MGLRKTKQLDSVILFECGVIIALLLVNWVMNMTYTSDFVADEPDITIFQDSAFVLHMEEEPKQEQAEKQEEVVTIEATTAFKLVDELFKTPTLDLKKVKPLQQGPIKLLSTPGPKNESPKIDSFVKVMPQFPGGHEALSRYVQENLHVNTELFDYGASLLIVVRFVVHEDGEVSDIKIVSINVPDLNIQRQTRVLFDKMPRWLPGDNGNGPVKVQLQLPISVRVH